MTCRRCRSVGGCDAGRGRGRALRWVPCPSLTRTGRCLADSWVRRRAATGSGSPEGAGAEDRAVASGNPGSPGACPNPGARRQGTRTAVA